MRRTLQLLLCIALLVPRAVASPASSPALPPPETTTPAFSAWSGAWQVIVALVVVAGLILALRFLLQRGGTLIGKAGGGRIKFVERRQLGPRQSLLLVSVDDQLVLLHQQGSKMTSLCTMQDRKEATQ